MSLLNSVIEQIDYVSVSHQFTTGKPKATKCHQLKLCNKPHRPTLTLGHLRQVHSNNDGIIAISFVVFFSQAFATVNLKFAPMLCTRKSQYISTGV